MGQRSVGSPLFIAGRTSTSQLRRSWRCRPSPQSEFVRDKFAKQIKKFGSLVETWSRLVYLGAGKANQSVDDALTESGHIVAC